jgi:hypothetical protein
MVRTGLHGFTKIVAASQIQQTVRTHSYGEETSPSA